MCECWVHSIEKRQLHSFLDLCPRRGKTVSQPRYKLESSVQVSPPLLPQCVSEHVLLINL